MTTTNMSRRVLTGVPVEDMFRGMCEVELSIGGHQQSMSIPWHVFGFKSKTEFDKVKKSNKRLNKATGSLYADSHKEIKNMHSIDSSARQFVSKNSTQLRGKFYIAIADEPRMRAGLMVYHDKFFTEVRSFLNNYTMIENDTKREWREVVTEIQVEELGKSEWEAEESATKLEMEHINRLIPPRDVAEKQFYFMMDFPLVTMDPEVRRNIVDSIARTEFLQNDDVVQKVIGSIGQEYISRATEDARELGEAVITNDRADILVSLTAFERRVDKKGEADKFDRNLVDKAFKQANECWYQEDATFVNFIRKIHDIVWKSNAVDIEKFRTELRSLEGHLRRNSPGVFNIATRKLEQMFKEKKAASSSRFDI